MELGLTEQTIASHSVRYSLGVNNSFKNGMGKVLLDLLPYSKALSITFTGEGEHLFLTDGQRFFTPFFSGKETQWLPSLLFVLF